LREVSAPIEGGCFEITYEAAALRYSHRRATLRAAIKVSSHAWPAPVSPDDDRPTCDVTGVLAKLFDRSRQHNGIEELDRFIPSPLSPDAVPMLLHALASES
jgi:hypothetical protein